MRESKCFELDPNIDNFFKSIYSNLNTHSGSFSAYYNNIAEMFSNEHIEVKLIIFMEDISQNCIVKYRDTRPINPLLLDKIFDMFKPYEQHLEGIIIAYGNEMQKVISGITINELNSLAEKKQLLNAKEYVTFVDEHSEKVDKVDATKDKTTKVIKLFDKI